ncbi:MBL fold metallo-hydrolase [Bacillus sp. 03113]|uniref:MBL fold metallo-hydrolase n=1 Tax=Bacillus sp. 03113 TaxID=2578211 RepID=UPI0011447236|nr:MBL fold metallo-hydrolase [Bacillus sp. 03113]
MSVWENGIAKLSLPTPFPVGDVNIYLVKNEALTLIDVGPNTKEAWFSLENQLKSLNLQLEDIDQVVLTHHHPDHSGLLAKLPATTKVYGHPNNERWIFRTKSFLQQFNDFHQQIFTELGVPVNFAPRVNFLKDSFIYSCQRSLTGTVKEGESPKGLSEWKVIETPGHAQSQICLFREKDGILISGDHLFAHVSSNPLIEPPFPGKKERPRSQLDYNKSLKKLLDYSIRKVYSGHGPEVFEVPDLVKERLSREHNRAMKVHSWLEKEAMTAFEICQRLFPNAYESEFHLAISKTVAQLDYLESLRKLHINEDQIPFLYSAVK